MVELFSVAPQKIDELKRNKKQFYICDTVFSVKKISSDSITKTFSAYVKNSTYQTKVKETYYYVTPKLYSNIPSKNNTIPYAGSIRDNKAFYNYIRTNTNSKFVAYIVIKNKVVFKDYIQDFKNGSNETFSTDKQLLDFLNAKNISYKIIENRFDAQSGRYFMMLEILSGQEFTINTIVLSKFDFNMKTYYQSDTLINWRRVSSELFNY